MDRDLEKFLINTLSTSFTNIGAALRLLLEARAEKEKIVNVKELENQVKQIPEEKKEQTEKKPAAKQKARKTAEAPRAEEVTEVEAPVVSTENKTQDGAVATTTPATEEPKAEGPAKVEEPRHKTTLIDVRKIMTDLTKRGKGDIIQKVLIEDFKVSKLSDVKEEDYDDFVARVQYYADELEVENA